MEEAEIRKIIMEKQRDQRISCKTACDIAAQTGVPPRKIGHLLDEMHIKIDSCQLGCFD
ncbi:MAG: hypothetical protein FJY85_06960 [Deltaproteobacteria bacterium]|nr:hypothetical protein [Deltaproteobacteria bacterium]